MDDWNEPRLVLAVHRAGSLTGAAKALGIDHSTAFRRLNAAETRLGVRLFERLPGGSYEATAAGERMAAAAERMEDEALALDRDIAGRDRRLSGPLRVTSSETLAYRELTRHLAVFRKQHPGIVVEMVIDNRVLSLSRREADIALRVTRPKEPDLFGRKLADIAWTLYAIPALLERDGPVKTLDRDIISWGAEVTGIAAADWIGEHVPAARVVYRPSSLVNQLTAARGGMGLVLLPCYLGDTDPALVRAWAKPIEELTREL